MKKIFPDYAWYHQGAHKNNERGLDLIGKLVGNSQNNPVLIGAQVKFHGGRKAPSQIEWLKFLAGCYVRRINNAIFVTTGQLTGEQRREAGEASILVIEGRDEIDRISKQYHVPLFNQNDS